MILQKTFIIGLIALGLFSCSEKTEPAEKSEIEISKQSDDPLENEMEQILDEKAAPEDLSFTNKSTFTISTKIAGLNENTGTDNIDIFLNNEYFDSPIKISRDLSYSELSAGESGIPSDAVFGYSTWFAGGGELVYGKVQKGVLKIYHKFEDEGMMEDEGEFTLMREIDPGVQTEDPAYYITYSPDDGRGSDIMIACSSEGKGLYAKYRGQIRHLAIQFLKDESEGSNIIGTYNELVKGEINGTYKMTHSGNWDYLQYTYKESGKVYDFTINHDETIIYDTYRTTPSF